jgi:hypothetical protein
VSQCGAGAHAHNRAGVTCPAEEEARPVGRTGESNGSVYREMSESVLLQILSASVVEQTSLNLISGSIAPPE